MNEYDIALKNLLMRLAGPAMTRLIGFEIARWHNVELPAVRHRRADLLGETVARRLVHIELQSANHPGMARRMLEYSLAIHRKFGQFPEQVVLYVGNAKLRMKPDLLGPGLAYHCRMIDVRGFESGPLLTSPNLGDNLLAVLTRLDNSREAVRAILNRIAEGDPSERGPALSDLMTLAGLRKLGPVIETEIEQMPILDDIMDHEVLGRERRRGIELGRELGREQGIEQGRREARALVLRQIAKRFGNAPEWVIRRIESLNCTELEPIALRVLDATSLESLFEKPA